MSNSPWHFPRTELAVMQSFISVGSTALTLFAPRRTGRTQFLFHDLAPAAERRKCTVVYASFWQTADTSVATLTHAIEGAIKTPNFWRRTKSALTGMKPKIRIAPMGIGGEIDLSRAPKPIEAKDPLLTLDDMIGQLPATYEAPLLLMLNEVQGLAAPEHLAFVAALRTSLDKRRDTVRTIFTGSSMDGLRAMFSNRQSPFIHFGSNIELPPLGEDFVRHVLTAHKAATKREVPLEPAMDFFAQVDKSPFMMRSALERMALNPDDDFETAATKVRGELAERQVFPALWSDLSPLAQAVLVEIVLGETSLTSKAARARMAKATDEPDISPGRVSGALRTLGRKNIIHKIDDDWTLQDPDFGRYVHALLASISYLRQSREPQLTIAPTHDRAGHYCDQRSLGDFSCRNRRIASRPLDPNATKSYFLAHEKRKHFTDGSARVRDRRTSLFGRLCFSFRSDPRGFAGFLIQSPTPQP